MGACDSRGRTGFAVLVLLGLLNQRTQALPQQVACAGILPEATPLQVSRWRQALTHALDSNGFVATSIEREARMRLIHVYQEDWIKLKRDMPEFRWVSAPGIRENWLVQPGGTKTPRVVVSGLGDSGQLRGTIMLPVSGRAGIGNARRSARSDRYTLYLQGESETTILVRNALSLDFVTFHEIDFQLPAQRLVQMSYHRSESLEPNGTPEDQVLELIWDGT